MSDKSPKALRADIEETREKLSEDLDELSYRFSPEGLKDQASETLENAQDVFTGATQGVVDSLSERVEGLSRSLLDRIKENPLPATLLGAGVSWLLMQGSQGDESGLRGVSSYGAGSGRSYGRAASYVNDPERAGGAVLDGSGELVTRTSSRETRGNPLLLGAGVLVAGLAVGLLVPGRRDRTGGANRGLASNAGMAARESGRSVQETVQKAVRETAEDAKRAVAEARDSTNKETRDAYDFDADRDYYRTHHNDTYTDTDFSYEDFEPAYRYGAALGAEEGGGNRTWDEAQVRSRWESEQRASWDTFGGAVRRGFERSRGR